MTKYLTIFALTIFGLTANSQTFNLTVNNGYGSGNYQTGDTVHIWSIAFDNPTRASISVAVLVCYSALRDVPKGISMYR